jgi:hypothetical protein
MNWLPALIESGRIVDLLVAVLAMEGAVLAVFKRQRLAIIFLGMLPGLCLMLALREALGGQDWRIILLWITASLPFHLADLRMRLK